MQEHGAAASGDTWAKILVDLDDEIVEVVHAGQPVTGLISNKPDRLVLTSVGRILAPGIFGLDWPDRQIGLRLGMAIGTPP